MWVFRREVRPIGQVIQPAHQSKIRQLRPAIGREQYVGRLDVAVHQAGFVSRSQRQHDLPRKDRRPHRLERSFPYQRLAQGLPARDVFHLDEMKTLDTAQIVYRYHVRMQQVSGRACFRPKLSPNSRLPGNQGRLHDLERTWPSQPQVLGLEHTGHRAPTQHSVDAILADSPAEQRLDVGENRPAPATSRIPTDGAGRSLRAV